MFLPDSSIFTSVTGLVFVGIVEKNSNEIAEVLFINLAPKVTIFTPMGGIGKFEFETFKRRLPIWKRRGFDQCREEYQQAKNENLCRSTKTGSVSFQDTASIAVTINKLLKFTNRRYIYNCTTL